MGKPLGVKVSIVDKVLLSRQLRSYHGVVTLDGCPVYLVRKGHRVGCRKMLTDSAMSPARSLHFGARDSSCSWVTCTVQKWCETGVHLACMNFFIEARHAMHIADEHEPYSHSINLSIATLQVSGLLDEGQLGLIHPSLVFQSNPCHPEGHASDYAWGLAVESCSCALFKYQACLTPLPTTKGCCLAGACQSDGCVRSCACACLT